MPNIIRHKGQVNEAFLPDGTKVERATLVLMKMGENIIPVEPVDDQDHFIYAWKRPISEFELVSKYGGVMPRELMGANACCSCGAEAVVLMDGPYMGKAICRFYAQFGRHQTSMKIKDGKLYIDKRTESEQMASAEDIIKNDIRNKPSFH